MLSGSSQKHQHYTLVSAAARRMEAALGETTPGVPASPAAVPLAARPCAAARVQLRQVPNMN